MKILVTGASGFVGQSLIRELVANQYKTYGLVRNDKAMKELKRMGVIPVEGDLLEIGTFTNVLKEVDAVVHCAAVIGFTGSLEDFYPVNVEATRKLVRYAIDAKVKKFIYISAAAIALGGEDLNGILEEYVPKHRIKCNYLKSKVLAEHELLKRKEDIGIIILRPPVIWGPGMRIMESFRSTIEKMGFPVIGDSRHHLATCHVNNLNAAIIQALKSNSGEGIYLVADAEKVEVKSFLKALIKGYGMNMGNIRIPKSLALFIAGTLELIWKVFRLNGEPPMTTFLVHLMGTEFTIDDSKIRRELGYRPVLTVKDGLRQLQNQTYE